MVLTSVLICLTFQGPQVYQTKFGPSYRVSYCTSIGLLIFTVIMICVTWFIVSRKDKRRAKETTANAMEDNYLNTAPDSEEEKR